MVSSGWCYRLAMPCIEGIVKHDAFGWISGKDPLDEVVCMHCGRGDDEACLLLCDGTSLSLMDLLLTETSVSIVLLQQLTLLGIHYSVHEVCNVCFTLHASHSQT